jgi:hypothetical protein
MRRTIAAAALTAIALMAPPAPAEAATTVGQTFFPPISNDTCGPPEFEVLQTGRADGTSYATPSNGVITSWSFEAGPDTTTLALRVYRPTGTAHRYLVLADAGSQTITALSGLHTFPTSIPVRSGDIIGIRGTSGTCARQTFDGADTYDYDDPVTPVGEADDYFFSDGYIWDISATVNPSNSFTLGAVTRNKKKGTATLTFNVPNPGELTGSGKGVSAAGAASISKTVTAPGDVQLLIKAKGRKKKKLNQKGKVKVKPTITFTPTGGDPSSQSIKVKLKRE